MEPPGSRTSSSEIGALVADTLQVGDHFQGGRDGPQVPGHRLLLEQQPQAAVFNIPLGLVHGMGQGDGLPGLPVVRRGQRGRHQVNGVLRRGRHIDHLRAELLELGVKGFSHI